MADQSMVEQRHGLGGDWLSAEDLAKTFGLWRGYVPNHGVVFRAEPPTQEELDRLTNATT